MKKMLMLILSALVISVIIFLGYRHFTKVETYTELSYSELKSKIESDGKFVLFIGKEDCSHCQKYKSTINKVVEEHDVTIYHVDISKLKLQKN